MATQEQQEKTALNKERAEWIEKWAHEHGSEFRAKDAAEYLNAPFNAMGPVLSGMVRRGVLQTVQKSGKRTYKIAPELQSDVTDLADEDFIPNLRDSLTGYLVTLNDELTGISTRMHGITNEANRIRAALKELS